MLAPDAAKLSFMFSFEVPGRGTLRATGTLSSGLKLAILGPSGCGKSTFLKSLCGFRPRLGKVEWNDVNLETVIPQGVWGFSFQSSPLFPHLNVVENLALPFKSLKHLNYSQSLQEEKIRAALKRAQLSELASRYPQHLSGGEKKRLSLIRALIFEAPLLILDEPFSDLDTKNREVFKLWLSEELAKHKGVLLYVTHSEEDLTLANTRFDWPQEGDILDFGASP